VSHQPLGGSRLSFSLDHGWKLRGVAVFLGANLVGTGIGVWRERTPGMIALLAAVIILSVVAVLRYSRRR
jgi:hypothetical protein